jgi:hypothetical protein
MSLRSKPRQRVGVADAFCPLAGGSARKPALPLQAGMKAVSLRSKPL